VRPIKTPKEGGTPVRLRSDCSKPMSAQFVAALPAATVCASCENDPFGAAFVSVKGMRPTTQRSENHEVEGAGCGLLTKC
jgi:hypothetical protein